MVGDYSFYINFWKVTLTINAPCSANYLTSEDLIELGQVSMLKVMLDVESRLMVKFRLDDNGETWESSCGQPWKTLLHNSPPFVEYNDNRIKILPVDKSDIGLHTVLV